MRGPDPPPPTPLDPRMLNDRDTFYVLKYMTIYRLKYMTIYSRVLILILKSKSVNDSVFGTDKVKEKPDGVSNLNFESHCKVCHCQNIAHVPRNMDL